MRLDSLCVGENMLLHIKKYKKVIRLLLAGTLKIRGNKANTRLILQNVLICGEVHSESLPVFLVQLLKLSNAQDVVKLVSYILNIHLKGRDVCAVLKYQGFALICSYLMFPAKPELWFNARTGAPSPELFNSFLHLYSFVHMKKPCTCFVL